MSVPTLHLSDELGLYDKVFERRDDVSNHQLSFGRASKAAGSPRALSDNGLLDSGVISRTHATIRWTRDVKGQPICTVTDLSSTHGTFVHRQGISQAFGSGRLIAHGPSELRQGDVLVLGKQVIEPHRTLEPVRFTVSYTNLSPAPTSPPQPINLSDEDLLMSDLDAPQASPEMQRTRSSTSDVDEQDDFVFTTVRSPIAAERTVVAAELDELEQDALNATKPIHSKAALLPEDCKTSHENVNLARKTANLPPFVSRFFAFDDFTTPMDMDEQDRLARDDRVRDHRGRSSRANLQELSQFAQDIHSLASGGRALDEFLKETRCKQLYERDEAEEQAEELLDAELDARYAAAQALSRTRNQDAELDDEDEVESLSSLPSIEERRPRPVATSTSRMSDDDEDAVVDLPFEEPIVTPPVAPLKVSVDMAVQTSQLGKRTRADAVDEMEETQVRNVRSRLDELGNHSSSSSRRASSAKGKVAASLAIGFLAGAVGALVGLASLGQYLD